MQFSKTRQVIAQTSGAEKKDGSEWTFDEMTLHNKSASGGGSNTADDAEGMKNMFLQLAQ